MPSSIRLARANLFAALAASPALAGWQVVFGAPDAYEEQKVVAVLGFGPVGDEPAAIGQRRQQEQYRIEVRIKAHDPAADSGAQVETDVMAAYDAVRDVVGDNPTLSGAVTIALPAGTDESPGALSAEGGGWVMFASAFVECVARIS
jgi:hypothetical protein